MQLTNRGRSFGTHLLRAWPTCQSGQLGEGEQLDSLPLGVVWRFSGVFQKKAQVQYVWGPGQV